MSLFVPKWSRLLEVIPGREHLDFWLDLFQFLPTQTIIPPYRTFTHLSPTFFFQLLSASISATNIRPLVEAEFDPGQD